VSLQADICGEVAEALRDAFAGQLGVTVAVEDACNPSEAIEKSLGGFGVLVLVATSGHMRNAGAGSSSAGDLALELAVVENPKRNRKSGMPGPTVTSVSEEAKDALHWRTFGGRRIVYVDMQRMDAAEDDYRMAVRFVAPLALGTGDTIAWGLPDGTQAYGEITRRRTARGGTPIFEPGRDGKARFTGVADAHLVVDLVANVLATARAFPSLGDDFTCPVEGVDTTFRCTLSELDESTENGITIHLAGRTVG